MKRVEILAIGVAAILAGCCCEAPSRCGCRPPCGVPVARAAVPPPPAAVASAPKPPAAPAAVPTSGPAPAPLRDEEVRKVLAEKRVRDASFTDASLDDVLQYLHTVTGLAFAVSPKVRAANLGDAKINMPKLDDVPAGEVLALITGPADLRWEVRDGVVWIVTSDEANPR